MQIEIFCSETVQSFSEQLSELDQIVRRMVLESLGVEKYLNEHIDSTKYLLRVMKYKGPESTDTKLGLTSHTDKNIVTILYQNQVSGLQVQTKDGKWITVKPSLDSFIVMIGDSFHVNHSTNSTLFKNFIVSCSSSGHPRVHYFYIYSVEIMYYHRVNLE